MTTRSEHACFDGVQGFYQHDSDIIGLPMRFAAYRPPAAQSGKVPVLFYLAGLTCTEETFPTKAGARAPHILIDQGMADKFLDDQLHPHLFEAACGQAGRPLTLRRHEGYDHSYYFISRFMEDHLTHHAKTLNPDA